MGWFACGPRALCVPKEWFAALLLEVWRVAGIRVHLIFDPALLARVDAVLVEGESRGEWVRRAVERALDETVGPRPAEQPERVEQASSTHPPVPTPAAPAEPADWVERAAGDIAAGDEVMAANGGIMAARPSQGARHDQDLMAPVLGVPVGVQGRVGVSAATKRFVSSQAAKRDIGPIAKPGGKS